MTEGRQAVWQGTREQCWIWRFDVWGRLPLVSLAGGVVEARSLHKNEQCGLNSLVQVPVVWLQPGAEGDASF